MCGNGLCMISLRGFGTKLANETGNNSARGFSEGKSEAMNYTLC